ncbi:MAG: chitobiase/beta-hexosaminidase C-terminal domain-containing protein [Muribaculaceae bacterium]|nr:chitobiase/beta-hexosaminidase C-terminal domain-containing protein [Muribaculaceae bacterium]
MKKILSLLTLMLLCTTAWAETVIDTLTVTGTGIDLNSSSYQDWSEKTFASDAVYAGNSARGASATNLSIQLRSKNSNSGIVTTASGGATVKKVTITFNSSTTSGNVVQVFGKAAAYNSAADLYGDNKGTLVGEITCGTNTDLTFSSSDIYPYIGLRSKNGAIYIDQIEIVWDTEASTATVAAPVIEFSPATAYEGDEVTCSISCATDGAAIQYSTDGETYQEYTGSFTLTETTTVYAKATLDNEVSEIAQKTITFTPVTTVANIAALNQLPDGTVFRMTGSATVVYNDATKYMYIKDGTGYTLLYNSANTAQAGYTVSNIVGTVSIYHGLFEAKSSTFTVEVGDTQVNPDLINIPNITSDNMNQYVKLENVSITTPVDKNFTITDAENHQLQGREQFSDVAFPEAVTDMVFDIEGFVGIYDGTIQFYPTKFTDVTPAAPFGITVTPVAGEYTEPVTVEISTTGLAEGEVATITYTVGDGEEQTYTEPFTLYKSATVTVMAECGDKSDIQEYTYTINLPALAFTMTPEPGTYQGEQNVTIACTNAVSDLTVVWAYTPEEGDTIEGDETSMTFTAAKSGVLTIMAEEANTGREYNTPEEGLTYTITEPIELDGMIVFADNEAGDANAVLDSDGIIGQATTTNGGKGGDYIESVSDIDKVYAGAEGLKFSSSSYNGTMTLNLTDTWNATKISFIAKAWTNTNGKTDEAKMTVNGNEFDLTKDFALYEFVPENQVEAITFAATKRAYLKVVNIEGETVTPQPSYDIVVTPTPEEGKVYKSGITVKAEVTPELPEGASLKYVFVETGATEEAVENDYTDAGVKLSKSGTLTFIARDAANAELARKSVDYTFSLVGDLNGDGIVDVSDVQYLVNIILGKVNFDE